MSKPERQAEVDELTAVFAASPNLYVTDFSGLSVQRITEFRRRLRGAGAKYVVVKNTLAQRALAANKIAGLDDHLAGPTGFVLSHDPLSAAKVLTEFAKEFEKPAIRAGFVDGATVTVAHIKRLGSIPPRDTLLAMIAGSMNNIVASFAGCLEALREQRGAAS
jgi:large subunit ribosomal protein L10